MLDLGGKKVLAFPNPAKDEVRFLMHLDQAASVKITIYNFTAEKISEIQTNLPAGAGQVVVWNCRNMAKGIYFAKVEINNTDVGKVKLAVFGK
jgi:hypothetical protein